MATMSFKDKVVLVTGAASGIGKIMSRKALERGASHLVIWDINEAGLAQTKQEFSTIGSGKISAFKVDISAVDDIVKVAGETLALVGKVDILINNAGIVVGKLFHEHSHKDISRTMAINSDAPMHITLEFLPKMLEQNSGAVCTISSSAGIISNPKMAVYVASKWSALGFTDSLYLEMQRMKKNIGVTTIMPFYINTGMFDGVKSRLIPLLEPEDVAELVIKSMEKRKRLVATPVPYWFIRLGQAFPPAVFDFIMDKIFGVYNTMDEFKGRQGN